jgi:transcriptional regulator with XRE-family HTH domain
MTLGQRIKYYRELNGLKGVDLADAVGISKQLLWKYESGNITNIPLDKFELIARALHVDPAVLAGWITEEQAEELRRKKK